MIKIISVVILFTICSSAYSQNILDTKGIALFKLRNVNSSKAYALSESYIIIKGVKYNLGEGGVFLTTAEMVIDSVEFNKVSKMAINYNAFDTKLFRDSIRYNAANQEVNYGGQIFVNDKKESNNDSLYIAYNIRGVFICFDSVSGRKIIFKSLNCYGDESPYSYPIYTPLHIKKYWKLTNRQIRRLSFRRVKVPQYIYIDCD